MSPRRMVAVCAAVTALGFTGGCAGVPPPFPLEGPSHTLNRTAPLPEGWSLQVLPGAATGRHLTLLQRAARTTPTRLRVIVIPGSGCTGFVPIADRYFAGLLHAQVQVLHKPGVDVQAGPAPQHCPDGFVAADSLSAWRKDAFAALSFLAGSASRSPNDDENNQILPTLLVGISEGGELLPSVATAVPGLVGLVLLSSSGLDPSEAGAMQAARLGKQGAWHRLVEATASPLPDTSVREGRTLRYWRDAMQWPLSQPLMDSTWPLLQVWGDADELLPPAAYERFAALARTRNAKFCSWRLPGANHSLRGPDARDGLQQVWARLDAWGRQGRLSCEGMKD